MLAPCYLISEGLPLSIVDEIRAAGVYEFYGPTWNVSSICQSASEATCGVASLSALSEDYEKNPMALKLTSHMTQMVTAQSF